MGIETLLKIISGLFTLMAASMTALWVYTKYILERGFLPPVEFSVEITNLGIVAKSDYYLINFDIHLRNLGSTTLVAWDIRLDIRYLKKGDPIKILKSEGHVGRLDFKNSMIKDHWNIEPADLIPKKIREQEDRLDSWRQQDDHRGFLVTDRDTFVQAKVDQTYTFYTLLSKEAICFLTYCSFRYAHKLSGWQRWIARLSRKLGLIQYTLARDLDKHTVEKVVWIGDDAQPEKSGAS
jgi:hypothetical protein